MQSDTFNIQNYTNCLVVTDEKIAKLYNVYGENVYYIPQGEQAKNFQTVQDLCRWFLQRNLKRNQTVVAVGGGSVGDTVGFACSTFKRGVKLLHVPTTLLAMVDSAIGGKTAIDLDGVKNAVGTFYQGDVLIDVRFLSTLDNTQMQNGMGEITKYRMLNPQIDDAFLHDDLQKVIDKCANYKQSICDVDPFDKNVRQKLNFGHTIGHAMELSLNLPHGLAVLNGIYYETILAQKLELCTMNYATKWTSEVTKLANISPLTDDILNNTLQDKKNDNDLVTFVLPCDFLRTQLSLDHLKQLLLG